VDVPYQEEKAVFQKLDQWVKGIVVMTKGPEGVSVSDGKNFWQAGIFPEKKLVDRTGAGDAFGSGFTAGMILGNSVDYAIRLASANATAKVEQLGAKAGLLTQKDFQAPRWGKLAIKKSKI